MPTKAGSAYIEMFLKTDKMQRQSRTMRRNMRRLAGIVTGVAAAFTAMGVAAGTAAAVGIVKAVNAASDLQETMSKLQVVFGEQTPAIKEWAEELGRATGRSRNELFGAVAGFQDMLVPMGLASDEASMMSKQLVELAGDLASFNRGAGITTDQALRDLQSAMAGSVETMLKYGVNLKGIDGSLTEVEKIQERYRRTVEASSKAIGDARRTSDTYAGSLQKIKTEIAETSVDLGDKFLPAFTTLAQVGVLAIKDIRDAVEGLNLDFDLAGDALTKLASSGEWEKVGELIGLQVKAGVRSAIGPGLFDAIELGVRTTGGLAASGNVLAVNASTGVASALTGGVAGTGAAQRVIDARTEALEKRIDKLIESVDRVNESVQTSGIAFE